MNNDAAFVIPPGAAERIQGPVGGLLELAVHGNRTGGRFTALTNEVGPGEGPPLHTHEMQDEAWFVLAGDLRFRIGDEIVPAPTGSWAFVPRGIAHCFQNVGVGPAKLLVMFTPAGMEPFFEAFAELDADELGPDTFQRLGEPCGMQVVGPPLSVTHPR